MLNSTGYDSSFFAESVRRDLKETLVSLSHNGSRSIAVFFQENIYFALKVIIGLENVMNSFSFIKEYGIYSDLRPTIQSESVIYILNPYLDVLEKALQHFRVYHEVFPNSVPMFICVPESTLIAEQFLEQDHGLKEAFPEMTVKSLDIDLQFFDFPFFSMNLHNSFRRLFCDGDLSSLRWVARFLSKAQFTWFGPSLDVICVGPKAKRVGDLLDHMRNVCSDAAGDLSTSVNRILIIDRNIDLFTPLLTQTTYEGLLDELYGFNCCQAILPFSVEDSLKGETNYLCGINDKIFDEMRDKPFSSIGSFLYEQSVMIRQKYEKRKELTQIREIREFVENLAELQETHRLIGIHTCVAKNAGKSSQNPMFRKRISIEKYIMKKINDKDVFEYIQELINRKGSFILVLRLLCLYSIANGGIKSKDYDNFKEKMMLSFGVCETVSAFLSLYKCGLLCKSKDKAKEVFPLWQKYEMGYTGSDNTNSNDMESISQLYGGYIPPIVRLIEMYLTLENGRSSASFLAALRDFSPVVHHKIPSFAHTGHGVGNSSTTVVFVVGGVTSVEVSGMRVLCQKKSNLPVLAFSTEHLSGTRIMNSLGIIDT